MSSKSLAIIDYGMGNLHSISKALQHVVPASTQIFVTSEKDIIDSADHVVFPGVGAMRDCMKTLRYMGLDKVIVDQVQQKKPLLGICLGMQALLDQSEEAEGVSCLSLVPGQVVHFDSSMMDRNNGQKLKIPHMGWNQVSYLDHPVWQGIPQESWFYFVHSYFAQPNEQAHVAATTTYGHDFACALKRDNLFAVQFHPEKSHDLGLKLLKNFVHWNGVL